MAGVYFKGLSMPGGCADCPMNLGRSNGFAACAVICTAARYSELGESGRLDGCPAHFVPAHGDLIDRDALEDDLYIWHGEECDPAFSEEAIDGAPVIIPADKEEDNG